MRGFPRRYKIIARRGSYHGMTYGAMSLTRPRATSTTSVRSCTASPTCRTRTATAPTSGSRARRPTSWPPSTSSRRSSSRARRPSPPSSASRFRPRPACTCRRKIYWQMLREICDKHGVLLIADEVINGFGRTGKMFAIEHFGIVPDIMTIAKALSSGYAPISAATIVRDSVFEIFKEKQEVPIGHLLTFGGHPVACGSGHQEPRDLRRRESGREGRGERRVPRQAARGTPRAPDGRRRARCRHGLRRSDLVKSKEDKTRWGRDHGFSQGPGSQHGQWRDHPNLGRDALRAAAGDHEGRDRPHGRRGRRGPDALQRRNSPARSPTRRTSRNTSGPGSELPGPFRYPRPFVFCARRDPKHFRQSTGRLGRGWNGTTASPPHDAHVAVNRLVASEPRGAGGANPPYVPSP